MTVAKVENTKVNIKAKHTLVKFMKMQKCLQGICPLRGVDTRRSLALRATYGGWKTFYGRPTLPTFPASTQSRYMYKHALQTNTPTHEQHALSRNVRSYKPTYTMWYTENQQAIGDDRNGFTDTVANDSIWRIIG